VEQVIGGTGRIKMIYSYLTIDRKLFRVNEEMNYSKIIRIDLIKNCKCSGGSNTFYIVNGSRIPTSRAIQINT
jgi:hypothetical protein